MGRALALVTSVILLWSQHGLCRLSLCQGPKFSFLGSCYQLLLHRTSYWGARDSCLACGGQLANASEDFVLAFLAQHLNYSSTWWVRQDAKVPDPYRSKGNHTSPCMILAKSRNSTDMQETTCMQTARFICRTEGMSCNTESQQVQSILSPNQDKRPKTSIRRRKRNTGQNPDIPADLLDMANQFLNFPHLGGHNLTELLISINTMMEDNEKTNITELNQELSLLNHLSERIQYPDVKSSLYFPSLSNVVYFGINYVLQSVLSSCSEIASAPQQKQLMTNTALAILQGMQNSTLSNTSQIGTGVLVQTPAFSLQLNSMNPSNLGQLVLSFPSQAQGLATQAQAVFPSQTSLNSAVKGLTNVQIQMMSFAQNPFISDPALNISGTVASLSVISGAQELHLQDLSDHFQIFLPRSIVDRKTPSKIQTSRDNGLQLSVTVSPPGSTLVIIVTVTHGVALQLYHGPKIVPENQGTPGTDTDSYAWILAPEHFADASKPQTFFVGPTNSSGTQNLNMSVSSFTAHCAFWDVDAQKWRSEGCKVGPQTTMEQVQCLCNHLSFFGSSFLVLPVQIDVTRTAEYFSRISENPVVVVLLGCFYVCYILVVAWARRMDLRQQKQNLIIVPRDNDPCALYRYRITVCTGHRRGAATSSKVFLSLCGSNGQFGPVLLADSKLGLFKSGSIDVFLLTMPCPLGELKSITLSHDGTGPRKSWYVIQVTAQDLQLKKSWYFLCNTWLSQPPKGESLTKTFKTANEEELTSFRNIFLKKTLRGLRDEHIWISVLNHPARSMFTRVQRVSCCMCLLLCTIVINLMFWEMPQVTYPVLISVGSFSLTWKDIMIAFESALLMFPVNLLIIYIFRNTRPKSTGAPEAKNKKGARVPVLDGTKNIQYRTLSLSSVIQDLERIAQALNRECRINLQLETKLESSRHIGVLLELISHMLHKQQMPGNMTVSAPLAQIPEDELHALFCAHYASRKLRKVCEDLKQLGNQEFQEKIQYDQYLTQLQALLHMLNKSVPPLPIQRTSQKQHTPKKRRLPWWFLFIGWALLLSISAVSTYFTMMYGFQYGRESSIRWIISMALSLFQSIFILQPLKVIGFAVFFALVLKKVDEEEEEDLLDGDLLTTDETYDETTL